MRATALGATLLWPTPRGHSRPIDIDAAGENDLARVRVTTDAREVTSCQVVAEVRSRKDRSLDGLRRDAAGAGANVVLLRELSEDGIAGSFFRCAAASAQTPARTPAPAPRSAVPTRGTPPPGSPVAENASREPAPETDRQRRARAELESLKASVRVIHEPADVASCEKRGHGRHDGTEGAEDAFRAEAVSASANVVLMVPATGGTAAAEYFRCGFPERPARKR